jgi:hypothetical protein
MKKLLLLSTFLLALHLSVRAQYLDWAHSYRGPGDQVIRDIATDAAGNVYIVGDFTDSIDLDPTSNNNVVAAKGFNDIFFAKADSNGVVQWIHTIGDINNELSKGIAIDQSGNVYICGAFTTLVDFDPGSGNTSLAYQGVADGFLAKYNNNGDFMWVRQQGGSTEDYTNGLACDNYGSIYITGFYTAGAHFDVATSNSNTMAIGGKDVFITKYDSAGNYIWGRSIGGNQNDEGVSIALDTAGLPIIAGYFTNVGDLDPGTNNTYTVAVGGADIFIGKLDTAGNYLWSETTFANTPSTDKPTSIHVVADDKIYFSGSAADQKMGLAYRLDDTAAMEKYVAYFNPAFPANTGCIIYDIAPDADGNFYVTGAFAGAIDFNNDTGSAQINLVTAQSSDIFLAKFDTSGTAVWTNHAITTDEQTNFALSIDAHDNLYLAGTFKNSIDCDYTSGSEFLYASDANDAHLHRLASVDPASVAQKNKRTDLILYPNPAGNIVFVKGADTGSPIYIYSSDGRLVMSTRLNDNEAIDVSDIAPGIYFIKIDGVNGRFLKQ